MGIVANSIKVPPGFEKKVGWLCIFSIFMDFLAGGYEEN